MLTPRREPPTPPPAFARGERTFYVVLAIAAGLTLWLVQPFLAALVLALVLVVVVWPLHARTLRKVGGRRRVATLITLAALTVGLFVPTAGFLWMTARELGQMGETVSGTLSEQDGMTRMGVALDGPRARRWSTRLTGSPGTFKTVGEDLVERTLAGSLGGVTNVTTNLLQFSVNAVLDIVIFYIAAAGMLVGGTELLEWVRRISPLPGRYMDRLFAVFARLSRNVLIAGVVGGLLQGVIAGAGYAIAGLDRWAVYGTLTAALSLVPVVGGALVWIPLVVALLAKGQIWEGVFLLVWSVAVTSTADNVVKPLLVRGGTQIPTLFIVLGVFGGLATFGAIGALLGPVILAFVRALLAIYEETYLVVEPLPDEVSSRVRPELPDDPGGG